ncbi:MAG: hypothetical protein PUC06_08920 [Oscillospiraceae bacterium]|nr:hypothetical protein [Oscillospiraceae bacterium]
MDALRFPKEIYTLERHVHQGKEIVYKYYQDILYCEKPVDPKYQTLNIKEPVSIGGKAVNATNAPIFFGIGCAGFLSSTAKSGGAFGPPPGANDPGPMPEGPMPPMDASKITSSEEWEAMAGGEGRAGGGIMGIATLGSFKQEGMPGPGPGGDPGEAAPPDGSRWGKLAQGYVIVEVGCRGRENQWPDGKFYGKAPAAIVDLKAAIRYLRHNRNLIPGDPEKIITTGGSGGGWQSTLVGASGNCKWFEPYLEEIGAAKDRDDVFASYSTSPIIGHEIADSAVEWQGNALITDPEEKKRSAHMASLFADYLQQETFVGRNGFGRLTIDNLGEYIAKEYLAPDATRYICKLPEEKQAAYLAAHPWISYNDEAATLKYEDFGVYAPRDARVPSFDDLGYEQPGPNLYGDAMHAARHFTDYALQLATGDEDAKVDEELKAIVHSQNPIWHILRKHSDVAPHWWIRHGACDPCLAVPPAVLLATAAENAGKDVNCRLVWDGGHCEDDDQDQFLLWVAEITEHTV